MITQKEKVLGRTIDIINFYGLALLEQVYVASSKS